LQQKLFHTKLIAMKLKLIAALKIWLVIYPSITVLLYFFGDKLAVMPLYQRTFMLTITLVPWMVFIGVPFIESIIRFVLMRKQQY